MNHSIPYFSLCHFNEVFSRETMSFSATVNGIKFKCGYETNNSEILILGDSLLRSFSMSQVDKLYFPGARADDMNALVYLPRIWTIIQRYHCVILLHGGNGVNNFPKNGILRWAQNPEELLWDVNEVCNALLPRRIFVLSCLLRLNGTDKRIKELNVLQNLPAPVEVIGLGNKMSSACVVAQDDVHLSPLGITLLRSIIKQSYWEDKR